MTHCKQNACMGIVRFTLSAVAEASADEWKTEEGVTGLTRPDETCKRCHERSQSEYRG